MKSCKQLKKIQLASASPKREVILEEDISKIQEEESNINPENKYLNFDYTIKPRDRILVS